MPCATEGFSSHQRIAELIIILFDSSLPSCARARLTLLVLAGPPGWSGRMVEFRITLRTGLRAPD